MGGGLRIEVGGGEVAPRGTAQFVIARRTTLPLAAAGNP